jgi:hypothetical protein
MIATFAHIMGVPVEETTLTLAPAVAVIVSAVAITARSRLAEIVVWLRRR